MFRTIAILSTLGALSCGQLYNVGEQVKDELRGGQQQCGNRLCPTGTECCNASCGTCVPPGGACTQQYCEPVETDAGSCQPQACKLYCEYGFKKGPDGCELCECSPAPPQGEACGAVTCGPGLTCCNASCGRCVPPGFVCDQRACLPADDAGHACPAVACTLFCPGGFEKGADGCDICACAPVKDAGVGDKCGDGVCGAGLLCCNASCGICAPPGVACTQQACLKPDAGSCSGNVCALFCPFGYEKDANGCELCRCAPQPGPKCGEAQCNAGQVCCNASCGVCTAPGDACTQQVCEPIR